MSSGHGIPGCQADTGGAHGRCSRAPPRSPRRRCRWRAQWSRSCVWTDPLAAIETDPAIYGAQRRRGRCGNSTV